MNTASFQGVSDTFIHQPVIVRIMKDIVLIRTEGGVTYTMGRLLVDGAPFCDTLEDVVRDTNHNGRFDADEKKVYGETAIPCGKYRATFEPTTLSMGRKSKNGMIPLLHDVPSFSGVRIHQGNTVADTKGCILLGKREGKGVIGQSTDTCLAFYDAVNYDTFNLEIRDEL